MGRRNRGKQFDHLFGAIGGNHPLLHRGAHLIKLGDFDQDWRHCGQAARDQFKIPERCQEGFAAAGLVLPALARLEAKCGQQAGEPVERGH